MKITKTQLKQLIKEELESVLSGEEEDPRYSRETTFTANAFEAGDLVRAIDAKGLRGPIGKITNVEIEGGGLYDTVKYTVKFPGRPKPLLTSPAHIRKVDEHGNEIKGTSQ